MELFICQYNYEICVQRRIKIQGRPVPQDVIPWTSRLVQIDVQKQALSSL
jgi:hypothetical protein